PDPLLGQGVLRPLGLSRKKPAHRHGDRAHRAALPAAAEAPRRPREKIWRHPPGLVPGGITEHGCMEFHRAPARGDFRPQGRLRRPRRLGFACRRFPRPPQTRTRRALERSFHSLTRIVASIDEPNPFSPLRPPLIPTRYPLLSTRSFFLPCPSK